MKPGRPVSQRDHEAVRVSPRCGKFVFARLDEAQIRRVDVSCTSVLGLQPSGKGVTVPNRQSEGRKPGWASMWIGLTSALAERLGNPKLGTVTCRRESA